MYACILGNNVVNVIIADADFIAEYAHDYDLVIPCGNSVGPGFTYSETNGFQPPVDNNSEIIDAEVIEPVPAIEAPVKADTTK